MINPSALYDVAMIKGKSSISYNVAIKVAIKEIDRLFLIKVLESCLKKMSGENLEAIEYLDKCIESLNSKKDL